MLDGAGSFFFLVEYCCFHTALSGISVFKSWQGGKISFISHLSLLLCCSAEIRGSSPGFTSLISMDHRRLDGWMDRWGSFSSRIILCRIVKHMKLFRPVYIYFQLDQLKALLEDSPAQKAPHKQAQAEGLLSWRVLMCLLHRGAHHISYFSLLNIGQMSQFTWMSSVDDLYMQATSCTQSLAQFVFSHWHVLSVL